MFPALRRLGLADFIQAKREDKVPGFALGYTELARADKRITILSLASTSKRLAHEYGHAALNLEHEPWTSFDVMSPYPFFSFRDKHNVLTQSGAWRIQAGAL